MHRRHRRFARAQAKTGTIVLLAVIVVAIAGIWFWQLRGGGIEKAPPVSDATKIGWCSACKKDFRMTGQEAAAVPKQGDKLQCPMCKKFEANWGLPPESSTPNSGVMLP